MDSRNVYGITLILAFAAHAYGTELPTFLETNWTYGSATYYDVTPNTGSCQYRTQPSTTFPYSKTASVSLNLFQDALKCGACYEVMCLAGFTTGNTACCTANNTAIVRVTDDCANGNNSNCLGPWNSSRAAHFVISRQGWLPMADINCGMIRMQYRQVTCPFANTSSFSVMVFRGSTPYWTALVIDGVNTWGAPSSVFVKDSSGNGIWYEGVRQPYNAWVFVKPAPAGVGLVPPLSVRVRVHDNYFGRNRYFEVTAPDIVTQIDSEGGQMFWSTTNFMNYSSLPNASSTADVPSAASRVASPLSAAVGAFMVFMILLRQ